MNLAVPNREVLTETLRTAFDVVLARLNRVWNIEHNADGTHKNDAIPVPFVSTDYTGGGSLVWAVTAANLTTFVYRKQGAWLLVSGIWDTTSTSGVANALLQVKIPGGYVAKRKMQCAAFGIDNGTGVATYNRVQAGGTVIEIGKADLSNWSAASASATYPRIHFEFEVQV